jgi:hypothetical protein
MSDIVEVATVNQVSAVPALANVTWEIVEESASQIRNLRGEINAQEKNIAIGGVFKRLRDPLLKHSRYDKTAPGWVSIFIGKEGRRRFGCDRRIAEKHILMADAFGHVGSIVPTCDLPSSFSAFALLAKLALDEKFPPTLLAKYLDDKRIHSNSTEREIRKIGLILGILELKPRPVERAAEEPTPDPISDLRTRLDDVGIDGFFAAMSPEFRAQVHARVQAEIGHRDAHRKASEAEAKAISKAKAAIAVRNRRAA